MQTLETLVRGALVVIAFAMIFLVPGAGIVTAVVWKVWQRRQKQRAVTTLDAGNLVRRLRVVASKEKR